MRKIEWAVLLGCILSVIVVSVANFGEDCVKIRESTLRLHILANSDSETDQAIKLNIRDEILKHSGDLLSGAKNRQELIANARKNLPEIENIANTAAKNAGCDLPVTVEVTDMFFETRRYDSVILPAGRYTAVRINIGQAAGKNWWCVLYPPLCVDAAATGFTEEEAEAAGTLLQEGAYPKYKMKLAVVEWWENLWKK